MLRRLLAISVFPFLFLGASARADWAADWQKKQAAGERRISVDGAKRLVRQRLGQLYGNRPWKITKYIEDESEYGSGGFDVFVAETKTSKGLQTRSGSVLREYMPNVSMFGYYWGAPGLGRVAVTEKVWSNGGYKKEPRLAAAAPLSTATARRLVARALRDRGEMPGRLDLVRGRGAGQVFRIMQNGRDIGYFQGSRAVKQEGVARVHLKPAAK